MKAITPEDLMNFVLRHRKRKVFKDFSPEQIWWAIQRTIEDKGFAFAVDDTTGRIIGLVCSTPDWEKKVLRINHVLTIDRRALPSLLTKYMEWFGKGWTMTACRKGKETVYRTDKLVRLLNRCA